MSTLQQADLFGYAENVPISVTLPTAPYSEVYEQNRHRTYALAFWMTDNELAAEELMTNTFCRILARNDSPTPEEIDRALIAELRQQMPLATLTLNCSPRQKILSVRKNTRRVDLEHAVVQLPSTERIIFLMHDVESYDHARVARTLGLTEDASRLGLHQARLRIRELLAK
jgi:RNA polymerase sigma-70 factor, ECF subfamily